MTSFERRNHATIAQMEWKMIKLGRVSKVTRGAIVKNMIEDLVTRPPGEFYPEL